MAKNLTIYQAENGAIELKIDSNQDTIWASLKDIADLFNTDKSGISRHIKNIFNDDELLEKSVVAKNATTGSDGKTYQVAYYNLDMIISIGYRVNSKKATQFRVWATQTLKQHITQGYTINPNRIEKNYQAFIQAVDEVKLLAKNNIKNDDVLELIQSFANTWFSLEAFDENTLPQVGLNKKQIHLQGKHLYKAVADFKTQLMQNNQAAKLFASEKKTDALAGIFANIFQSAFGKEVYPTVEAKAAHLLYFIVKNHPFNDGNKRTGAFSFVWFLKQSEFDFYAQITPETLTTLTLLIAISNPSEKDKLIGLVLLLLTGNK